MTSDGRYLYGVIRTTEEENLREIGIGDRDNNVYTMPFKDIAAVVSNISSKKIRPERKNLASHNNVIRDVMKKRTLLPMAFGHISPNGTHIKKLLAENYESFSQQLNRLDGKVEMGLKALWDVENIFEFFVRNHRELEMYRDEIFSKPYGPSHEEKIELGRKFENLLNQERDRHTKVVTDVLRSYCHEIKQNKPKHEKMVINLALLVDKDGVERFEKGIFEAAKVFNNNYSFDYNGPWAPHNFVQMTL